MQAGRLSEVLAVWQIGDATELRAARCQKLGVSQLLLALPGEPSRNALWRRGIHGARRCALFRGAQTRAGAAMWAETVTRALPKPAVAAVHTAAPARRRGAASSAPQRQRTGRAHGLRVRGDTGHMCPCAVVLA